MSEAHPEGIPVLKLPTNGHSKCPCVRWHRPVPAEDEGHHQIPVGAPFYGAQGQPLLYLCPTAHSSVHAAIRVWLKAREKGRVPTAAELRPYTRFTRKLAKVAIDALPPLMV